MEICTVCHQKIKTAKPKTVRRRRKVMSKQSTSVLSDQALEVVNFIAQEKDKISWVVLADCISVLEAVGNLSERRIASLTNISKSEVHRLLLLSELPIHLKVAATGFNTEKYVLLEWQEIEDKEVKAEASEKIMSGEIKLRRQLKEFLKGK